MRVKGLVSRTDVRYDERMLEMVPAGEEIAHQLISLRRVIDQLELKFSQLAAEFDQTDWWDYEGFNSSGDWIRFNCRMTSNAAYDRLAVGEPLARKSGEHDDRLLPQRYADALVELASAGRPANIQVTATIETLKGMAGAGAAEMEFSLPISSVAVQRMACDCSVTRVLLSQESLVMDVGRAKPIVSSSLRRALKVRDGHCRWPGCERTASKCDGHHVVHWINGGPTDLDNLVLLCRRHHRMVHEGGWQLIKCDDGQIVTIAPTVTFGLPRGPD